MKTRSLSARSLIALAVLVLVGAGPLTGVAQAAPDRVDDVEAFNRDVFVIVGSTLRNPDADTSPDAFLYNNVGAVMEFSPGHPLTWGEWSAAGATGRANFQGGRKAPRTAVTLRLSGLIPGGLYSVFWGTIGPDSEQPLCPGVERTLPLDSALPARDRPDANSFVASADGSTTFRGIAPGNILSAHQVFYTVVYHLYGGTYYPFPNAGEQLTQGENCRSSFGEDSMRHLVIFQKF